MKKPANLWKLLGATFLSVSVLSVCAAAINHTLKNKPEEARASVDYSAADSLHSAGNAWDLFTTLQSLTFTQTTKTYNDLWTLYNTVYKDGNYIKDYYSDITSFTYSTDQCGSNNGYEGGCYNREHSIPKSWWGQSGSSIPIGQGTDPYIVIPTDALINNIRSNYALGVVKSAAKQSNTGYSKLGAADNTKFPGYTGTVFEPNDDVKGDLARIHFYATVRYSSSTSGYSNSKRTYEWTSGEGSSTFNGMVPSSADATNENTRFCLTNYAIRLFSAWNKLDPPDDWEKSVNDKLKTIMNNTNPFVDHPEYADTLWGGVTGYTTYGEPGPSLSLDKTSATITSNGSTTITASASGGSGSVSWSITSGSSYVTLSGNSGSTVTVTGRGSAGTAVITASFGELTKTCTITVKSLNSIAVSTAPTKTTYTEGQYFNPAGLVIRRNYSDSSYDTYEYEGHTSEFSFTPSTSTALTTSNTSVTITYGGKSCNQAITVNASGGSGSWEISDTAYVTALFGSSYNSTSESSYSNSWSSTNSGFKVNITNANNNSNGWNYIKMGSKSSDSTGTITTDSGINTTIGRVSITIDAITVVNITSIKLYTSSNGSTWTEAESFTKQTGTQSIDLEEPTKDLYYKIEVVCTKSSSNGTIQISKVEYFEATQTGGGSEDPTLSSISVKTASSKTTYNSGENFSPTGLVITATYSDSSEVDVSYAGHTSEFSFTPSTSTALTTSDTSVTITYGGKSCNQAITVNSTSITATPNKTFYVGETITASDITVVDNDGNPVNSFTFSSYEFKYTDAASGGALTNKLFNNAVTGAGKTTSLTVQVQRKAYVTPVSSVTDEITADDLTATTTSYLPFNNLAKKSDARYSGCTAKTATGGIQLRTKNSDAGIFSTQSGGTISSVTITIESGTNTVDVYGKNTAYTEIYDLFNSSTQGTKIGSISSTGTIAVSGTYTYIAIRSSNGACYISSIEITYAGSTASDSADNVANYIMYEDTNNQCTTKYSVAKGYFNNLSSAERNTFMTSSDYVIATARERLEAWARYEGETISNTSNGYVIANNGSFSFLNMQEDSVTTLVLVSVAIISSMLGCCFTGLWLKKRREQE